MKIFTCFLVEITVVALFPFPLTSYSCVTTLSYVEAVVVAKFPSASSVRAVASVIDTGRVVLVCSVTRCEDESCGGVARVNTSLFDVHCSSVFVAVDLPFTKPLDGFWVVVVLGFVVVVVVVVGSVVFFIFFQLSFSWSLFL